ncbi:hypothetical protein QQP08_022288 [Theobroma cacao]|nr:hypothetical protein QQP08_022288 [Theobroma cacao]
MAKSFGRLPAYTFLFLFFLLLVYSGIDHYLCNIMLLVEAQICQRRSLTWSGFCGNSGNCDLRCRNSEGALQGACHRQFLGFACFCYFRC